MSLRTLWKFCKRGIPRCEFFVSFFFSPQEKEKKKRTNLGSDGYGTQHPRSLFKIPTSNKPMVIVPTNMLDDLKAYPEEAISFRKEMSDRFLGRYTSVASNSEAMIQSVKSNLTRGLDSVIPIMQEEVKYAIEECLGNETMDTEGWVKAPLYALSVRIIAFVSSRVFVGLPLSRNQEW